MSAYGRDAVKSKCVSLLLRDEKLLENIMKFGKNSATLSK